MTGYESQYIGLELRDIARWFIQRAANEPEPETKQSHTNDAWICSRAADAIELLRARVAELLSTIRKVAQSLEWHAHGRCRGLDDEGPMSSADAVALAERVISASDAGLEAKLAADSREIEDLRARIAMLEADENEGSAITAMPIQIGDDLCYLPVNAHGIVTQALRHSEAMYAAKAAQRCRTNETHHTPMKRADG